MPRLSNAISQVSTPAVLAIVFAGLYLALGPGCFFSVDEVVVQEMAQAVYQRGTLEIPAMNTAIPGRAGAYYSHRGPALGYIAIPFVTLGTVLDNRFGSMDGGTAIGQPLGTLEHPLRWGGRFSIFTALMANAIVGGLIVAMLYLIAIRFGVAHGVAVAFACSTGAATLLASEATHFFQHPLEAFALLCGFWFMSSPNPAALSRNAWFGGLSLGLALLARPNTAPAAVVLWIYGIIIARRNVSAGGYRAWLPAATKSAAAPAVSVLLYLIYNWTQYGSAFKSGYGDENGAIFHLTLSEPIRAVVAYLVSPSLSLFLFAPLLLFVPAVWKESLRRWPLESKCLLLASAAHFSLITFLPMWDGAIAYGPRYALAPLLMIMPLALPAFEKAFAVRMKNWRRAMIAAIVFGAFVQVIGLSVYVVTNEWYYNQHNIYQNRDFIFMPSASPVWVQLRDLIAGRNIIPWAVRVISKPGPGLALLLGLTLMSVFGAWILSMSRTSSDESKLPGRSILTMAVIVVLGFFATTPVVARTEARVVDQVSAGLAAQQAGRDVEAEELYALVLSVDAQNKFALHNLALLYEKAGKTTEAVELYRRAVAADPTFTPSVTNLSRYPAQPRSTPTRECGSAAECYEAGKRLWDLGNKPAALAIWKQAAEHFPTESSLVRSAARAQYDLGDYKGAEENYRRAIVLDPANREIRTDLAWTLLATSNFREAQQICREVLAQDSGNAAAKAILARMPQAK